MSNRTESIRLGDEPFKDRCKHPAKMHGGLALELIEDYSTKGQLVVDPFAGSNTTGRASSRLERCYISFELERSYALEAWGDVCIADSRFLPLADNCVDLILTSPPYGEAIGRSGDRSPDKTRRAKADYERKRFGRVLTEHAVYGSDSRNLGNLPLERKKSQCFVSEFPLFVNEMYRVLQVGARALLVLKEQRRGRKRLGVFDLPGYAVGVGVEAGFIYEGRRFGILSHKYHTLWQRVNWSRFGIPIPDVETVIVLRK